MLKVQNLQHWCVIFGISGKTNPNKTTQTILNQLVSIKCLLYVQQNEGICE